MLLSKFQVINDTVSQYKYYNYTDIYTVTML